jgi:two-component system sensor histidine kinase KdpD
MLTLTQQMGGTPLESRGSDIVEAIATFAKEYGITHLVLGRTQRPWYRRFLEESILEQLLREVPDVDVIVVSNR